MYLLPKMNHRRGEVATLLTIVSMAVIGFGLFVGAQVSRQVGPVNTAPQAASGGQSGQQPTQGPITSAPTPTPINKEFKSSWFEGSQSLVCAAKFTCTSDPVIRKLELRAPIGTQVFNVDKNGNSPLGLVIGSSCSGRAQGIQIDYDPTKIYSNADLVRDFKINQGDIVISVVSGTSRLSSWRGQGIHYFVYPREFAFGADDAEFYFEFDAKLAGVTSRYSQKAIGKKGCTIITPTPTTPTITPVPLSAACFENCSTKNPTVTCNDPRDPTVRCFETVNGPTPTKATQQNPGDNNGGQSGGGLRIVGPCKDGSAKCQCLPSRCIDGDANCSSKPLACNPPKTVTPPPTVPPQACTFNSYAYVQECTDYDLATNICHSVKPINPSELKKGALWGTANNRQMTARNKVAPVDLLVDTATTKTKFKRLQLKVKQPSPTPGMITRDFYVRPVNINFPLQQGQDPTDFSSTSGIVIGEPGTVSAELYSNGERNAFARLFWDEEEYSLVSNQQASPYKGNEILRCDNVPFGKAACQSIVNGVPLDVRDITDREIRNFNIQCGDDIVYGWTLQKCKLDLDYVFVIDTSTSMATFPDPYAGQGNKVDAAIANLNSYVEAIKNSGTNSRVALVNFNSDPAYSQTHPQYPSTTAVLSPFTASLDGIQRIITTELRSKVREGTCIECGLKLANDLVTNREDSTRRPMVILLSDGLPNSQPGDPNQPSAEAKILTQANGLKGKNKTLAAIGYGTFAPGDPGTADAAKVYIDLLKKIASNDEWVFSTNTAISTGGNLSDIMSKISAKLNSCPVAELNLANSLRSKDVNKDGVINSVDLFLVFDNYFARGENIAEDVNGDKIVNSLDVTEIFSDFGTVVSTETK